MSRLIVISTLSPAIAAYVNTVVPTTVFYKTINNQNDISDPLWSTIEFTSYSNQNMCYDSKGSNRIESGVCDVILSAEPGTDPDILNKMGDDLEDQFHGFSQNGVVIKNTISANDTSQGDAGKWYQIIVTLEYDYFY